MPSLAVECCQEDGNTRSPKHAHLCPSGSRSLDEEEVDGANDDDDYTSADREEATIKFSFPDWKSVEKTSDEELLVTISEVITYLPLCRRTSCDCLGILSDVNVRECVAQYLLQFVKKSKYDQDSIILEWDKYVIASMIRGS